METLPASSSPAAVPPRPGHSGFSPPDRGRLGHAKALDGIRGLAVLAVLGHNLDIGWLRGGFFGVDIFFALSGFLITTLLLEDYRQRGTISLGSFFRRRCLRLYPALIVLVAASTVSALLRSDVEPARIGLVAASTLLYVSNWLLAADSQAWMGGLGPTWSLAVEMHFYVFWAVTLAFVLRRWGARLKALTALAIAVAAASAAWRAFLWAGGADDVRLYAGTDTRIDAIFLGVVAALIRVRHLDQSRTGGVAALSRAPVCVLECFLVMAVGWLICRTPVHAPIAYLGGFGLVGGATALLILISLLSPHSLLAGPLQIRPLVWFGQISYSLYLWHLPVSKMISPRLLDRAGLSPASTDITRVLASIAVAAGSYYCVERVVLRRYKLRDAAPPPAPAVGL